MAIGTTRSLALALALSIIASAASAHPHVFVTAKEEILFGPDGRITGIRHAWTFDDMYSAFAIQGLGPDDATLTRQQLQPLAQTNVESLAEFGYFTVAKTTGKSLDFGEPKDYFVEETPDKLITLTFTLPLKVPVAATRVFTFQVYDPTYFVAFDEAETDPVSMVAAPQGCSANVVRPAPLAVEDSKKLSESYFTNLSPGANFGIKLAGRIVVACP